MIGKLTGRIESLEDGLLIIDVQGVGYVVKASARTLRALGGEGTPASLWIETQVREDAINLFGFADKIERAWFRLLTTVQGVGAKVALAILSSLSPDEIAQAIAAQDKTMIARADGVGPKLALRITTELKDKTVAFFAPSSAAAKSMASPAPQSTTSEAISALINLGYKRGEAFAAVMEALHQNGEASLPLNDLIRQSLSRLSQPSRE